VVAFISADSSPLMAGVISFLGETAQLPWRLLVAYGV
jgi:hypothetical protein